jgi:oligopeptide/dipeptide ABC transporter ATP-binding protein
VTETQEDDIVLSVEGLKTYFHTYEGVVKAIEGIDVRVRKGETLGLVGETGCGKSVTALSVMGLIPMPPGKIEAGRIFLTEPREVTSLRRDYDGRFDDLSPELRKKEVTALEKELAALGKEGSEEERKEIKHRLAALTYSYDLLTLSRSDLNAVRGNKMSMIFQEPMTALNPVYTVGDQIGETIELHQMDMLVDDVLDQLLLEKKAFEDRGVAKRLETARTTRLSDGRKGRSVKVVCSLCGAPARDDWGACTSCGGAFSRSAPRFVRRLFFGVADRYYKGMKANRYNAWAYLVRSNSVTRRFERRLGLAKTIRSEQALREVKIAEPSRIVNSYPFELSGGMRQRAMIAMMMSCRPDLLIADEPTTALDVTVEAQILSLMKELQRARGTSILLITHDLGIIAEICQRVAIMYAGYIVELAETAEVFERPMHPYTNALLRSVPKIGQSHLAERKKPLYVIPGSVPNLLRPPAGCRFHPRCERAMEICRTEAPLAKELAPGHLVSCHNPVMMTRGVVSR